MNKPAQEMQNPLRQTINFGQSVWYDGLIGTKEFERMIREDGIRGATTNPAIFEKAIAAGDYDKILGELSKKRTVGEIYKIMAVKAVQEVADQFLPVYEETAGADGYVSIEVNPHHAHDTQATLAEAKELWLLAGRRNVMIKIPATDEGIPAIRETIAAGINVNITLIFSLKRYRQVIEAYLQGLESRAAQQKPLGEIASVASFFVSRVDTAIDEALTRLKAPADLFGKAGIANSKVAYAEFEKAFSSERFERLKKLGARLQRPLWASTGTKNPRYSDVLYVEQLMGPDTVNTIPPPTLDAFRDHGVPGSHLKEGLDQAQALLGRLAKAGIDLDATTERLEKDGAALFCDAYDRLAQGIRAKLQ